ncbi:MAG: hypothetical protein HQL12_09065 [Candidatus Omnitrophica bacterium]|nr:hypothetical protein [Candidatus Omnitrophota bacterium]
MADQKPNLCHFTYELALLLTLCILILTPFHLKATKHYNIDRIIDASSVSFSVPNSSGLAIGDSLPVYRFNPDWTSEIGRIKIASFTDSEAIATFDLKKFSWPMGRQGRVLEATGPMIKVSVGYNLGLKKDDFLILYKDRTQVGRIQLQKVYQDYSLANLIYLSPAINPIGLTASEFIAVTQTVVFKNPFVVWLEILLFLFIFLMHCYLHIFRKTSILLIMGNWLRTQVKRVPKKYYHLAMNIALGVPFVWFMANFTPRCFFYLTDRISNLFIHSSLHPDVNSWMYQNINRIYIIMAGVYILVLVWKKTSPILLFWQWVAFKPKENKFLKGPLRDFVIWCLHFVIFYVFGWTLWGFLTGNLTAIFNILWPGTGFSWDKLSALSLLPPIHPPTVEQGFLVAKYLLWSVTILGCLFGYWYSVLGYLYGKRIRNLDFTIMGWITNAVCYGPLLGVVIWQMCPSLSGLDPTTDQGPLKYYVLVVELLFNLLYTLSIFNLGTMFGIMTDKGVRTSGFYSVTRHPSYTLEAFMFVLIFYNGLCAWPQWLAVGMFLLTYYVRSEREDQFMAASNPEYKLYQEKTPYKFIPGIY